MAFCNVLGYRNGWGSFSVSKKGYREAQLQGNWTHSAQHGFNWMTELAFSHCLARMEDVKTNSHNSTVRKRKLTLSGETENDVLEERTHELVW